MVLRLTGVTGAVTSGAGGLTGEAGRTVDPIVSAMGAAERTPGVRPRGGRSLFFYDDKKRAFQQENQQTEGK
jgi:hypothetical protein